MSWETGVLGDILGSLERGGQGVQGRHGRQGVRETGFYVCGFGKAFSGVGWSPSEKSVCPCPWFLSFIGFLGCRHGWDKTLRSKYLIAFYYILSDWMNICYRA